jgi:hypothetical protein
LESARKEPPLGKYEVFRNAPITEAVLEVVVLPLEGTKPESLIRFHEPIKERFPKIDDFVKSPVHPSIPQGERPI